MRCWSAWTAIDFAAVTATAIGIDYSPSWVVLVTAAVGGLLDVWCWDHLVRVCAAEAPARRRAGDVGLDRMVLVPVSLALAVTGFPVLAASGVPAIGKGYAPARRLSQDPPPNCRRAVMLADGFQSNWQGSTPVDRFTGFYTTQFSYAGLSVERPPAALPQPGHHQGPARPRHPHGSPDRTAPPHHPSDGGHRRSERGDLRGA
ncbi:MAG: hypothetical protein ACRDYZ_15215 [Acidimicrobiales bacterium]